MFLISPRFFSWNNRGMCGRRIHKSNNNNYHSKTFRSFIYILSIWTNASIQCEFGTLSRLFVCCLWSNMEKTYQRHVHKHTGLLFSKFDLIVEVFLYIWEIHSLFKEVCLFLNKHMTFRRILRNFKTQKKNYNITQNLCVCVCVCVCVSCSVVSDSLWPHGRVAHQAPLSMGFSRQESWSGLPFPSPAKSLYS